MAVRAVWKITFFTGVAIVIGVLIAMFFRAYPRVKVRSLTGVVLVDDMDTKKQRPISGVKVDADGESVATTDAAGLFNLKLSPASLLSPVTLSLQHANYVPAEATVTADGRLFVLHMKPASVGPIKATNEIPVSDIRVRYTESARTSRDTGSALKTFQIVNTGNVSCGDHPPCSPDGKWRATLSGASLDAGEGNEFREARVSCIAGPCPFTRIEKDGFSRGGRYISVAVRNWSDTVSFVLEAEVTRTAMSDLIRTSYPIISDLGMNFTLPPSGEGPCILATVGGTEVVYPLGPRLNISWASCSVETGTDQAKIYRCDLKPGYRFQAGSEAPAKGK
jgi:hypothetical protein